MANKAKRPPLSEKNMQKNALSHVRAVNDQDTNGGKFKTRQFFRRLERRLADTSSPLTEAEYEKIMALKPFGG